MGDQIYRSSQIFCPRKIMIFELIRRGAIYYAIVYTK